MSPTSPPADRRAGAYGLMQGAMSMGFALGPGLGGLLGNLSPTAPFWAAAAISLINAAYGYFVVPESLPKDQRAPLRFGGLKSFGGLSMLRSKPGLFSLSMILMLAQFATMVFPTVFVLYSMHRYHWNITAVSICMTAFGVCSALVQARVAGPFVRRWGEHNAIIFGLLAGVFGTFIFGLAPNGVIYSIGIPIMTLSGLAGPAVQSLMTRKVAHSEQGRLQGANTSVQSVAGIVAPVLFGWVFAVVVTPHPGLNLIGAPFYLASVILVGATVVAWRAVKAERTVL